MISHQIEARLAEGYVLIQCGLVHTPFVATTPKPSFADRVHGFDASKVRSGDVLLDDDHQWAHLRRPDGLLHRETSRGA